MTREWHLRTLILCVALCTAAMVGCDRFRSVDTPTTTQPARETQSTFTRVLASKTLRCSYCSYPPYCIKDPNTGALSGIFVDAVNELGRRLELRVEWVEEVGWGTIFEGLESGRYDIHGSGLWRNSSRGKHGYFSNPLFYNAIRVWVRAEENRFHSLADLNSSDVRISVQDGAIESIIADSEFPKAQPVSIPQLNPWSDNLLNIITNKADVTFAELGVIVPFLKKNPGTLKELDVGGAIRVFANSIPFRMGEDEFKSMLDSAIDEIRMDGTIDSILEKYESAPGEHLRVAKPYASPEKP